MRKATVFVPVLVLMLSMADCSAKNLTFHIDNASTITFCSGADETSFEVTKAETFNPSQIVSLL